MWGHGRQQRFTWTKHVELNNTIKRALSSAEVGSKLELPGSCRSDGKRVDYMSIIPWSKGKFLLWDSTCTDTFASTNLKLCAKAAGKGAERVAVSKRMLYVEIIRQNYFFVPFNVATMGPWCTEGMEFINQLGRMIALNTNEPRSTFFLKQCISLAIQRGNVSSIMGTMANCDEQCDKEKPIFCNHIFVHYCKLNKLLLPSKNIHRACFNRHISRKFGNVPK